MAQLGRESHAYIIIAAGHFSSISRASFTEVFSLLWQGRSAMFNRIRPQILHFLGKVFPMSMRIILPQGFVLIPHLNRRIAMPH